MKTQKLAIFGNINISKAFTLTTLQYFMSEGLQHFPFIPPAGGHRPNSFYFYLAPYFSVTTLCIYFSIYTVQIIVITYIPFCFFNFDPLGLRCLHSSVCYVIPKHFKKVFFFTFLLCILILSNFYLFTNLCTSEQS